MNLAEFIDRWTGQPVDVDGIYPNQCMDLMHAYVRDVLGLPVAFLSAPSAMQVFTGYKRMAGWDHFELVDNTPQNVPQPGDLVFWNSNIGQYGHVSIFVDGTAASFTSFDANWPLGSLPHLQAHTYEGVVGWLHPLPVKPTAMESELTSLRAFRQAIIEGKRNEYRIDGDATVYQVIAIPSQAFFEVDLGDFWSNVRVLPADWPKDPALWAARDSEKQARIDSLTSQLNKTLSDLGEAHTTVTRLQGKLDQLQAEIDAIPKVPVPPRVTGWRKNLLALLDFIRSKLLP